MFCKEGRLHLDDRNSILMMKICPESGQELWSVNRTTNKKAQRSRVNVMNLLQKSQHSWNIFFFRASVINRRTQNFTIIDQEKHKIEQIYIWSPMTTGLIMSTLIYVISMEFPLLRQKRPSSWNAPSHKEWGDMKRAWSQAGDKGAVGSFIYYFISN